MRSVQGPLIEEWQISLARSAAGAGGHENPTFHVGGVTDLPFEDDSFDAAHCHAVLMHVLDTQAVLAEVKRILKPGGIISSREMTVAFSFLEPLLGSTEAAWDTFSEPYRSQWRPPSDGEGTENTFLGAGFSDIRTSASFGFFSTTEDIAFLHTFISDWFYSPDVIAEATKYRLATQQQFDDWCLALDQWKSHAGALAEGEGTAFKP